MTAPRLPTIAAVLAAGQGKRMRSDLPKVLHEVAGTSMASRVVRAAEGAGARRAVVVVGYRRDLVRETLDRELADASIPVAYAVQEEQRGTADAVASALAAIDDEFDGWLLILNADVPNLRARTLRELRALAEGAERTPSLAIITARVADPSGYGRIVRDERGDVVAIVEDRDCDASQAAIDEINAGLYLMPARFVRERLAQVSSDNAQGELYVTDLVGIAVQAGGQVQALVVDEREAAGVNDPEQLAAANAWARAHD